MPTTKRHIALIDSIRIPSLISLFGACFSVSATEAFSHVSVATTYNDNVGLSAVDNDKTTSALLALHIARTYQKTLGISHSFNYGVDVQARAYSDYPCDQAGVGLQIGYQRKWGLGFSKPIFSIGWRGAEQTYEQSSRNRRESEVTISVSKPVGEQFDTSLSVSKLWEIPDRTAPTFGLPHSKQGFASDALDKESVTIEIAVEYYANANWSFPASLSYIDGDIVSGARRNPAIARGAVAITNDLGMGNNWFVYRHKGTAWSTNLTASRLLANGSSVNFAINRVDARSDSNIRYDRNSVSFSWVKSW